MILASFILITACSEDESQNKDELEDLKSEPHIAKVLDIIPASSYLYLQVSENKESFWIAIPAMEIESGETIYFSKYMVMKDFKSESIDRTFDEILFVEDARKSSAPEEMKKIHSGAMNIEKQDIDIKALPDGKTIAQIYNEKSELNGETVKVKGKVVKFNKQIMKRNWIHIQDGTGDENSYDLAVTSQEDAKVGDVIVVSGKLAVDKNFGSGYFFPVIIEEAEIVKE
jgi:hypothetical protein